MVKLAYFPEWNLIAYDVENDNEDGNENKTYIPTCYMILMLTVLINIFFCEYANNIVRLLHF